MIKISIMITKHYFPRGIARRHHIINELHPRIKHFPKEETSPSRLTSPQLPPQPERKPWWSEADNTMGMSREQFLHIAACFSCLLCPRGANRLHFTCGLGWRRRFQNGPHGPLLFAGSHKQSDPCSGEFILQQPPSSPLPPLAPLPFLCPEHIPSKNIFKKRKLLLNSL